MENLVAVCVRCFAEYKEKPIRCSYCNCRRFRLVGVPHDMTPEDRAKLKEESDKLFE